MKTITRNQAREILTKARQSNQFYSAKYIKKDGTVREAVAHPHVTKHLKGGNATYNASNSDNIGYYDLGKSAYRCFNLNRVVELKHGGETYKVED